MITRKNHMSFTVSELDRSLGFFRDALGLSVKGTWERDGDFAAKVTGIAGARLKIAMLEAPNCMVELIEYVAPRGEKIDTRTCNVGSAHVCFNVQDFDAMLERAIAGGGRLVGEPTLVPGGGNAGRAAVYLEDPDGNTIEFISEQPVEQVA